MSNSLLEMAAFYTQGGLMLIKNGSIPLPNSNLFEIHGSIFKPRLVVLHQIALKSAFCPLVQVRGRPAAITMRTPVRFSAFSSLAIAARVST